MTSHETQEPEKLPEFIAVTGLKGSGKDYLSHYLENEFGYLHVSSSDVIRQLAREQGYSDPIPREVLSRIGDEFKREFGPSPITESSVARYEQDRDKYPGGLVISGLRRPPEAKAFKEYGASVLWVYADDMQRIDNVRRRDNTDVSSEDFQAHDRLEYEGPESDDKNAIRLKDIEEMADYRIANDNTDKFLTNAVNALKRRQK